MDGSGSDFTSAVFFFICIYEGISFAVAINSAIPGSFIDASDSQETWKMRREPKIWLCIRRDELCNFRRVSACLGSVRAQQTHTCTRVILYLWDI